MCFCKAKMRTLIILALLVGVMFDVIVSSGLNNLPSNNLIHAGSTNTTITPAAANSRRRLRRIRRVRRRRMKRCKARLSNTNEETSPHNQFAPYTKQSNQAITSPNTGSNMLPNAPSQNKLAPFIKQSTSPQELSNTGSNMLPNATPSSLSSPSNNIHPNPPPPPPQNVINPYGRKKVNGPGSEKSDGFSSVLTPLSVHLNEHTVTSGQTCDGDSQCLPFFYNELIPITKPIYTANSSKELDPYNNAQSEPTPIPFYQRVIQVPCRRDWVRVDLRIPMITNVLEGTRTRLFLRINSVVMADGTRHSPVMMDMHDAHLSAILTGVPAGSSLQIEVIGMTDRGISAYPYINQDHADNNLFDHLFATISVVGL